MSRAPISHGLHEIMAHKSGNGNAIQWPLIAGFPHFRWPRVLGKSARWEGEKGVEIEWPGDDNDNGVPHR